jgi:Sugar (and other) transporter
MFIVFDFRIRGRLGSVYVFSVAIGILLSYTCGTLFPYRCLPFIYAPISVLFLIGEIFYPDSAHFFVLTHKDEVRVELLITDGKQSSLYFNQEAEKSINFFRGVKTEQSDERVKDEFRSIQSLMSARGEGKSSVLISDFCELAIFESEIVLLIRVTNFLPS